MIRSVIQLFLIMLCFSTANAAVEVHKFETEIQQQHYKKLIDELRCLVCQNQNLADSNAELAQDLRNKVAKMIKEGNNDQQIIDYMVARYGDFVLYRPPFKAQTLLLWLGPFIILVVGFVILFAYMKKQNNKPAVEAAASSEELDKARKLLDDEDEK